MFIKYRFKLNNSVTSFNISGVDLCSDSFTLFYQNVYITIQRSTDCVYGDMLQLLQYLKYCRFFCSKNIT